MKPSFSSNNMDTNPYLSFQNQSPPLHTPLALRAAVKTEDDFLQSTIEQSYALAYFMLHLPVSSELLTCLKSEVKIEHPENYGNELFEPDIRPFSLAIPNSKQCPVCGQCFVSFKGMKQHYGKLHSPTEKMTRCLLCSKLYKNKYALNFHVKQVHEKQTRVKCEECGKVVYNKYILKKHLENKHFAT